MGKEHLRIGDPCLYRNGTRWQRGVTVEVNTLTKTALVRPQHAPCTEEPLLVRFRDLKPVKVRKQRPAAPRPRIQIDPSSPSVTATTEARLRAVPKALPRLDAPDYRAYLAEQPCSSCPPLPCGEPPAAPSEVHHYGPRGVSERASDAYGAPLCRGCHRCFHRHGHLPGRTAAQSRELLHRVQVACLLAYLEERAIEGGADPAAERVRLLRLVVGVLEGELRAITTTTTNRRWKAA